MNKSLQRDRVIDHLTFLENGVKNKLLFVTPDFGAKALDLYRETNPELFIFPGISEQFSVDYCYGASLLGKNPILYGMSPFLTTRCIEQFKVLFGQTNENILLMTVGHGIGYDHNTLSHYSLEDISLFYSIPGFQIYTPFTSQSALQITKKYVNNGGKFYLRLDRQPTPDNISDIPFTIHKVGRSLFKKGDSDNLIVTYGSVALDIFERTNNSILILEDLSLFDECKETINILNSHSSLHLIEESFEYCGIYSKLSKLLSSSFITDHSFINQELVYQKISRERAREQYLLSRL